MKPLSLLFCCTQNNKFSVTALAAAVEHDAALAAVRMRFPQPEDMAAEAALAFNEGGRVICAFSFFTADAPSAQKTALDLRKRFGDKIFLMAGGPHATALAQETLELGFDAAGIGEGEISFPSFLRKFIAGENWRECAGFAFIKDGRFHFTGRAPVTNLDEFFPIAPKSGRYSAIEISRGCPNACAFCQVTRLAGSVPRYRSVEKICEAADIMAQVGMRDFRAVSPNAFAYGSPDGKKLNLSELERLLAGLRAVLGQKGKIFLGTFPSEVRPEHVTPQTIALVRKYADNDNLVIGAQSGSERILTRTNRGHGVPEIFTAAELCLKNGIIPNFDFIFGLPGETAEDARQSLSVITRLAKAGARIHAHTFMPLPGTPLWKEKCGDISAYDIKELRTLSATGRLYGIWHRQKAIADATAKRFGKAA